MVGDVLQQLTSLLTAYPSMESLTLSGGDYFSDTAECATIHKALLVHPNISSLTLDIDQIRCDELQSILAMPFLQSWTLRNRDYSFHFPSLATFLDALLVDQTLRYLELDLRLYISRVQLLALAALECQQDFDTFERCCQPLQCSRRCNPGLV